VVRIKASNTVGNSAAALSNSTVVFTVPDAPTLYNLTPQINAIDISFSAPTFNGGNTITKYQYYLNGDIQTAADISITSQSGSINYATISSLINGTTYTVAIRAINARGVSAWSATKTTIPFTVPNASSLAVTAFDKYVRLFVSPPAFNGGNAITSYQYSLYGPTTPLSSIVSMGLPATVGQYVQYDVSGLINATTYSIVVRSVNARGYSEWSNTVLAIPNSIPDPPILTSAVSFPNAVTITFSTPYDGGAPILAYYYSIDDGDTYTAIGGTATQYTIPALTNGTTYTIRVKNENKNGLSTNGSNAISVTPFTTPASPILLDVVSGVGAITILFRSPVDNGGNTITRYEYSSNGGATFSSIGIPALDTVTNTRTYTTSYQSTGDSLINGQTYSVVVRAVNYRGNSPSTNTISVIPFDVPSAPTLVSASPGKELIRIVYSAPTSNGGNAITQYEYLLNGARFFIEDAAAATQIYGVYHYTYANLAIENEYEVAVVAWNARGNSVASNSFTVVPEGPPQSPTISVVPQDEYVEIAFYTPNNRGNAIVRYEYSMDGGNTYANISSALPAVDGKNVFNVYGLSNGNAYTVAVRSVNLLGTSPWSNKPVIVPYTYPVEPAIHEIIPLRQGIRLLLDSVANDGGNTVTGYKYAFSLGSL
jgi:titin